MNEFIRVWRLKDIRDIEKHLLVVVELSSECFACHKIGLDLHAKNCPDCGITFKYMGFRRKLTHSHLHKLREERPDIILIDFDDFKRSIKKRDAHNIFDS